MRTLQLLALAAALGVVLLAPASAGEAHVTKLHIFGNLTDGANPGGIVAGPNGVFYGVTAYGGTGGGVYGYGTVFELQPPPSGSDGTWTETVLYSFTGQNGEGIVGYPVTPVISANGVLYGATSGGGISGSGTVFELQPPSA